MELARVGNPRGEIAGRGGTGMRLYLAGPMSGKPDLNFKAFNQHAAFLRFLGHEVFNPAEALWNDRTEVGDQLLSYYLRRDLPALVESDAVAVLPGWRESRG